MDLVHLMSLITIIYIYYLSYNKNNRKLSIFLSKPLNNLLFLILILIVYQENKNIGILFFIMLFFSKYYVKL
jgi:hypothetical protein